jgi:hypothetical protein
VRQAGTSPESGGLLYQCRGDAEAGAPESVPAAAVLGVVALPIGERLAFRLLDPPRRALNQLLSKLGIRVRHG